MPSSLSRIRLVVATLLIATAPDRAEGAEPSSTPASESTSSTAAPPSGGLERVKDLFGAASFADCVQEARRLLQPASSEPPADVATQDKTRTYLAACQILQNDVPAGRRAFEEAIRTARNEHRRFPRPNTLVFPPPVVSTYDQVYGELEEEFQRAQDSAQQQAATEIKRIDEAKQAELERQAKLIDFATEESVVIKNQRWLAAVPFGVGQFQNRKPGLGWLFLVSEALALGTTVVGITYELDLYAQSQRSVDTDRLNSTLGNVRLMWNISAWALVGLAAVGVAEAELNFVPEFRQTRRRELPPNLRPEAASKKPAARLSVEPFSPAAGGAGLGLVGRF
jgi:hypothetical protein